MGVNALRLFPNRRGRDFTPPASPPRGEGGIDPWHYASSATPGAGHSIALEQCLQNRLDSRWLGMVLEGFEPLIHVGCRFVEPTG